MERDVNVKNLFQDLLENGSMDEDMQMGQKEIIHPVLPELPFRVNEAVNMLRGNIQMSGYNLKVIAITSALAHEGKSSIAFRLACSMAGLNKRVLYIDCDIRNSRTSARYKIQGKHQGLSEYLCGKSSRESIIFHTEDPWMDMIFTGAKAPNPSELVSGRLFRELMAYARQTYDYVIADTPPLNVVIDGLIVAKQCDGAILVVESGLTERAQAEKAREQLQYADIKILGAVLNKADVKKRRYGYGYGYGYGYEYEYENKDENGEKKKGKKRKRA